MQVVNGGFQISYRIMKMATKGQTNTHNRENKLQTRDIAADQGPLLKT